MRRFTRLTNGFSKKIENHEHALALYFMYYNFVRVLQTLRVTPSMEAGNIKSCLDFGRNRLFNRVGHYETHTCID